MQVYDVLADNIIEYRVKQVYGVDNMYIVSPHAKYIEIITSRKTLVERDKKALEALGFVFKQVL